MRLSRLKPYLGPKHYIFKDPDTGYKYEAENQPSLVKQIVSYRDQNELEPIKHLDIVLENYWANLPENAGAAETAPPLHRGFIGYIKGGIALFDNLWYGEKNMVSQHTADERAIICTKCPHNVFPDKGAFLTWADSIAEASVGDRKSRHHTALGNCAACSCPLRAKVFYKGPFKCSDRELVDMPDFCWQKKECLKNKVKK
jgi:hypothetical protein